MPVSTRTYSNIKRYTPTYWSSKFGRQPSLWSGSGQDDVSVNETKSVTSFRGNPDDDYAMLSGTDLAKNIGKEYRSRFDNGHEFRSVAQRLTYDPTYYVISAPDIDVPTNGTIQYRGPINSYRAIPLIRQVTNHLLLLSKLMDGMRSQQLLPHLRRRALRSSLVN